MDAYYLIDLSLLCDSSRLILILNVTKLL